MQYDDIDVFHELEQSSGQTLNWLLEQILSDQNTAFAAHQLQRLAAHPRLPPSLLAMTYYRVLRRSLESRRYGDYWRCCRLFEREVLQAGKSWTLAMAVGEDWTSLGDYVKSRWEVARLQCQLRAAILLPRGLSLCDAVAFQLFSLCYERPAA